jgi:hypothetical protein
MGGGKRQLVDGHGTRRSRFGVPKSEILKMRCSQGVKEALAN